MAFDGYIMLYPKKNKNMFTFSWTEKNLKFCWLPNSSICLLIHSSPMFAACILHQKVAVENPQKCRFFWGGQSGTSGWWFGIWFFSIDWEFHHPNWETPSFFTGAGSTTNQTSSNSMIDYKSISQPRLTGGYPSAPGQRSIRAQVRGSPLGMEPIYTSTPTKR